LGSEAGVLAVLSAIGIVFFVITSFAVRSYRTREAQLAKEWADRGHKLLQISQPAAAVASFQTALRYDPGAQDLRYAMVDSLLAAKRSEQARSYLLTLWEHEPANGIINLDLARIAAFRDDPTAAVRYYHNAIYGIWDTAPQQHRTEAQLELIRYLLHRGAAREADAELVTLAANAPSSPQLSRDVGSLFLEAGDVPRAFEQFTEGLQNSPRDPQLLAGAGKAAFAEARYDVARDYLEKARQQHSNDPEIERLLDLTRLIRGNDPFDRRFSFNVRSNRALAILAQADDRVQQCMAQQAGPDGAPPPELSDMAAQLADMRKRATLAALRRNPDMLSEVSTLAFSAEETAAQFCGQPQGLDEALLLIARQHAEAAAQ